MSHTAIPQDELNVFASLKNARVVFDVGSRDDVDYLILKPKIKLHAFEPNPIFFEELKAQVGHMSNVYLNNYGLSDKEEELSYNDGSQSFIGGVGDKMPLKTLDWYIKEYKIKKIDFLKVDVEGLDLRVLLGGKNAIKITRYIQYEHWGNDEEFHQLLKDDFSFNYIGGRNTICTRKGEKIPSIPEITQEGGLTDKNGNNRLHNI